MDVEPEQGECVGQILHRAREGMRRRGVSEPQQYDKQSDNTSCLMMATETTAQADIDEKPQQQVKRLFILGRIPCRRDTIQHG